MFLFYIFYNMLCFVLNKKILNFFETIHGINGKSKKYK